MPDTVRMVCNCGGDKMTTFYWGARGDTVRQLQAELTRWGLYEGSIDGIFGPKTDSAVRKLQAALSIGVDGIVGPVTWAGLFQGTEAYPGRTIASELWNPYRNIEWAALYLVWLRNNVSSEQGIMLAAYNGGPGNPVVRYAVGVQRRMARIGM